MEPTGTIRQRNGSQHLVLERVFRAPIEAVWAAITEPSRLARWIGTWSGDPTTGLVDFEMTAEGAPPAPCTITACEPPRLLALELAAPEGPPWTVRLTLTESGDETTLEFDQALAANTPVGDVGPGWDYYLDRLVAAESGSDVTAVAWDDYATMADPYRALSSTPSTA